MAEPSVAIDPQDPRRMAVAADPYLEPARIEVSSSTDAGQHWSAAITLVPPGATKSYDPQLGFAADGTLLVSGGASPDTRHGCQRASVVFLAAIRGAQVSYHVLATAPAGGLLDRPTLLAAPGRPLLVAWTSSPGPGADCSLRPSTSTTQVALLTPERGLRTVTTLPHAAQAPFGSELAASGDGVVGLAVAGRDGTDGISVEVYQSSDGTQWRVGQAGHARAEPDQLPGLGGSVLSMPSITGLPHGFAVAWTDTQSGTERTRIARNDGNGWQQVAAPPADAARLLPTLAAGDGALAVIQAGLGPDGLRFYTWQQLGAGWFALAADAGGSGADRHELGEGLGLAVGADGSRITAVPVELLGSSALLVRTQSPPPSAGPRSSPAAHARGTGPARSRSTGLGPGAQVVVGFGAAFLVLALVVRGRARRRYRRRR